MTLSNHIVLETQRTIVTDKPLLSVAMIAYNVAKYLPTAIDSVLSQKTNFEFELVIGEDCSTDSTRDIIIAYQKKYPHIIKPLFHKKNIGLTPNSIATQNACEGKYIALLDGDDYWTNNNKLQHQVDILEDSLEFSASSHQAEIVFDDIPGQNRFFGSDKDEVYTLKDTIQHRKFHTSSLVYRRKYWTQTGGIPISILSNERAIYPMLAIFGKINYLKENMCVYRKSTIGITARISYKELSLDLNMIPWLKNIDKNFPAFRFRSFLHLCIYSYPIKMKIFPLLKHYVLFVFYSFSYFPKNIGDVKHGTLLMARIFKRDILNNGKAI